MCRSTWEQAIAEIAGELKQLDPKSVVFYSSGRASLEASYLYALFARMYGTNNLPDSSNMCHESTSVGLPLSIGVPVGTVTLEDFEKTDCIIIIGHNTGVNAPRMLHPLAGLRQARRADHHLQSAARARLRAVHQPAKPDRNAVRLVDADQLAIPPDQRRRRQGGADGRRARRCSSSTTRQRDAGRSRILDADFIARAHRTASRNSRRPSRATDWTELELGSGLTRTAMEAAAAVYARAKAAIIGYGMGLTQHVNGVDNVQMLVNLLLMRGNIGKPGAGVLPIRGHSNVQGQRTVGITEKPELVPNDKLKELYGFEPPQTKGTELHRGRRSDHQRRGPRHVPARRQSGARAAGP